MKFDDLKLNPKQLALRLQRELIDEHDIDSVLTLGSPPEECRSLQTEAPMLTMSFLNRTRNVFVIHRHSSLNVNDIVTVAVVFTQIQIYPEAECEVTWINGHRSFSNMTSFHSFFSRPIRIGEVLFVAPSTCDVI